VVSKYYLLLKDHVLQLPLSVSSSTMTYDGKFFFVIYVTVQQGLILWRIRMIMKIWI